MKRVFSYIVLALMSSSCTETKGEISIADETTLLTALVKDVGAQMAGIGFPVSTDKIEVKVSSPHEMLSLFKDINEESRQEVKNYTAFAPSLEDELKNDDAVSRLAFYDPNTETIVFQAGASKKISAGYLAHELAHVYQDQKWGLENTWRFYRAHPSREMFNITQYIIEGHAELARHAYEQSLATNPVTMSDLSVGLGKVFESECVVCDSNQSVANLPYSMGLRFLLHQYRSGGWKLVEDFFNQLPLSSEQIIHPKKLKKDNPKILKLPQWQDKELPAQVVLDGPMGEAYLLTKLLSLGVQKTEAFTSASGWDGDIAHLYRTKNGDEALVWRIVFDRDIDAQQLSDTLRNLKEPQENMRIGRVVDWVITDSPVLEAKLRIFMSKNPQYLEAVLGDQKGETTELGANKDQAMYFTTPLRMRIVIGPNH